MSRCAAKGWLFGVAVFFICTSARGQSDYYTPENLRRFAEYLYQNRDYVRAAGEFQRCLLFNPRLPANDTLLYKIGRCYQLGEKPGLALNYYQKIIAESPAPIWRDRAIFQSAYTYFAMGQYAESNHYITKTLAAVAATENSVRLNQLRGLNLLYQKQWRAAQENFAALPANNRDGDGDSLTARLHDFARRGTQLRYKSRTAAGLLSTLIPGAGKIYAGRRWDGFYSLLFIGLNAWQAHDGFADNGAHSVKGWIYGSLAATLYLGNIYGSVVAVKLRNEKIEHHLLEQIHVDLQFPAEFEKTK